MRKLLSKFVFRQPIYFLPEFCQIKLRFEDHEQIIEQLSKKRLLIATPPSRETPFNFELKIFGFVYKALCKRTGPGPNDTYYLDFEISDPSQRKLLQVDFAFLSQGSKLRGIAKSKLHDNYRSPEWHGYGYQKTVLLAKIEGSKLEEAKFLIQKNQARYSIKFREEKFVYVRKNKFDLDDDSRNHCLRQVALICLGLRQLNDSPIFDTIIAESLPDST